MGPTPIDPEELLQRIRGEHRTLRWQPLAPDPVRPGSDGEQIRSEESLTYLHRNWMLPDT